MLVHAHQYVLDSVWGDVQPSAHDENDFLASHSWDDYAEWYPGLTDGATDDTKSRYAFGYGDFRRVHRSDKEVELAAHTLLQYLDDTRA
jgi:hypothetical protein